MQKFWLVACGLIERKSLIYSPTFPILAVTKQLNNEMKQLLILMFTFSILSSCDLKKSDKIQSEIEQKTDSKTEMELNIKTELEVAQTENKKDTIYNYWELILDSISDKKDFKILNKNYKLELKTFSLNDSLIVRNLGQGKEQTYLDHSHTMVTDIKLWTDSIVDQKRIDRTDFEKLLIPEFYAECNLFSTEIDSVIGKTVYLTSDLAVPDKDNQWRVWYSIKLNKKIVAEFFSENSATIFFLNLRDISILKPEGPKLITFLNVI